MAYALDPEVNTNVQSDMEDKSIQTALEVIAKNLEKKNERDSINEKIQDLFEAGFEVREPKGARKINSKRLFQAMWRMAGRMKPLDFAVHGTGRGEAIEKVVSSGISTIMDKGGYVSALRNKNGAFFKLLLFGDGFTFVGANPEKGSPIVFNPVSNTNIYTDQYANGIRTQGWGMDATKLVAVFSYSWAEFVSMFPGMDKKAGLGRIPRETETQEELERDDDDKFKMDDVVEVAYFYDIDNKVYSIFAGAACTLVQRLEGDEYPFVKDNKPYIPVLQWICYPGSEGFYNYGIGNMIYDLALMSQQMMNMELGHITDNTYPVELVNVPQGTESEFFNKLSLAHEMRVAGKRGYVAMGYDPNAPAQVSSQTLTSQNMFNEWQNMFDRLDRELQRMGIFLDEIDRGGNVTATQIMREEVAQNAFIKQIMEYNASESKFAVELTIDMITEFISKGNKMPVDMTVKVDTGQGEMPVEGVTMGMISEELKTHNYFVRVNARTGAYPSEIMRAAQINRGLSVAQPGSAAQVKLYDAFSQVHDLDIPGQDFLAPMQTPQAVEPEGGGMTQTDRQAINVRSSEAEAIL